MSDIENSARTIRVFSPEFPYPPRGGSPLVILNQILDWVDRGKTVELVCWQESPEEIGRLRCRKWIREFPAEVVVRSLPCARASRGLRILRSFFAEDSSTEVHHYPDLMSLPDFPPVDLEVYHYSFAWRWLRARPRRGTRVAYFHNLESDLARENAAGLAAWDPRRWVYLANAGKMARHELELDSLVDELWMISPVDLEKGRSAGMRRAVPKYPLFPQWFPCGGQGRNLGFVGSLDFKPNALSVEWLLTEIAPRLQASGFSREMEILGRGASSDLRGRADAFDFVRMSGFTDSLEEFWSRIGFLLVPDLGGSGVRVKLLEALWRGVPVLCNPRALDRIDPALRSHALLFTSDDPAEWVKRILNS